jgi:hypothetical protein
MWTRRDIMAFGAALSASAKTFVARPLRLADSIGRREAAMSLRLAAAESQATEPLAPHLPNGDETAFPRWIAAFTKGLGHDQTGEVTGGRYEALLAALESGKHSEFEMLQRGSGRRLVNPQAGYAYNLEGGDSHRFGIPPPPSIASKGSAAEMIELYWQAATRDVPFIEYESSPLIRMAADELETTPSGVFRGPTKGDLDGPYASQFLLKPIPYNSGKVEQRYRVPLADASFLNDYGEWLQMQTGLPPWRTAEYDPTPRYIRNGRDLAEWVHYDVLYQAYLNAALILMDRGPDTELVDRRVVLNRKNPYRSSFVQEGFVTFGCAHIADWLGRVSTAALKAAWCQKWLVHRRLRPEALGGRVHQTRVGAIQYPLHPDLLASRSLDVTYDRFGTYLLPQAYPEGAPLHPAYPSGHATVAGACSVVLKAFFDEGGLLADCVHSSADGLTLLPCPSSFVPTIGAEVNKLAFNVAMGRDWAGIHYRSDAEQGLKLGEEVGISVLQDLVRTFSEEFDGFEFTRFDGRSVRIAPDGATG